MANWDFFLNLEVENDYDLLLGAIEQRINEVEARRYLMERTMLPSLEQWSVILRDTDRYNDGYFLRHFRVERDTFWSIETMLSDLNAFRTVPTMRARAPVSLQLMTFLKYVGTEGTDGSYAKIGDLLGISPGSVNNYMKRTTKGLMEIRHDIIKWPDAEERCQISNRMVVKYGFKDCVGATDGTLFPLEYKPSHNGEEYFTRKGSYAVHGLLFVDDMAKIRHLMVGRPGSVHDNRVWRNSVVNLHPESHFSEGEYLLGDSAFTASEVMVPAYKKPAKSDMGAYEKFFNTKLAKARIKTEHAIGLVKARFPRLKKIRVKVKTTRCMEKIVKQVISCAVLHNMLVNQPLPLDATIETEPIDDNQSENDDTNLSVTSATLLPNNYRRNEVTASVLAHFNQS